MRAPLRFTLTLALMSFAALSSQGLAQEATTPSGAEETVASDSVQLIEQLGADSFWVREQAVASLISAGSKVEAEVREALDHDDVEIRYRSHKVLIEIDKGQQPSRRAAFLAGDIDQLKSNKKSWQRLEKLVGNTPETRQLFLTMLVGGEEILTKGETSASECSALITQLYDAQSHARRTGKEEVITPGGVTAMVFVLSDSKLGLDTAAINRVSSLLLHQYRARLNDKNPAFKTIMGKAVQNSKGTQQQYQMLRLSDQFGLKEDGVALARKMLGSGHNSYRARAMLTIGQLGDKEDVEALAKYVNDSATLGSTSHKGGQRYETRLGDVALAMAIVLSGKKPEEFGFPDAPGGKPTSTSYHNYGFYDDANRKRAQKKWAELFVEK